MMGSEITFEFVPLHSIAGEIAPNVARHYDEMNVPDSYGCPNIDWDYYLQASVAGHVMAIIVRDSGHLVGYSIYAISTNPRYKHILEASSEGTFLEKPYRGRVSLLMLQKADEFLKEYGVKRTSYTTNDNSFGKVLNKNGYEDSYKVWSVNYGG